MRGAHSAHDDGRLRAEGPALSAASQRNGRHTPCRIKHDSDDTADDKSAVVNAANDRAGADGQEEQQRQFAAAEVDVPTAKLPQLARFSGFQ